MIHHKRLSFKQLMYIFGSHAIQKMPKQIYKLHRARVANAKYKYFMNKAKPSGYAYDVSGLKRIAR